MKKRCGCEVVLATYLTEDLDIATKELVIRVFIIGGIRLSTASGMLGFLVGDHHCLLHDTTQTLPQTHSNHLCLA